MPQQNDFADRENLSLAEQNRHRDSGALIEDDRRRRPLWFDGRFLDAAALKREQNYFIARQDDIAQVAGTGVVDGLLVARIDGKARAITIDPGQGITPSGEVVTLPDPVEIDLADVAQSQALDLTFGVSTLASDPPANASGLFIVALRRVQYTSEPLTAYPTDIDQQRSLQDGSVIEATLITMIPYADQGTITELTERRRHVAREIFVDGSRKGQPTNVLPLALLALRNGTIDWLDTYLVRRHVASSAHEIPGLGITPRVLREAHLVQYRARLAEALADQPQGFAATDEFLALPAAGPMPAATINADDFTQSFFPASMDVELSIVPDDELYAMVDESFSLPPIDLGGPEEALAATSVLVLIPVPRSEVRSLSLQLKDMVTPLKPSAPGIVSKVDPVARLTAIGGFNQTLTATVATPVAPTSTDDDSAWRQVLQRAGAQLWYTRRRSVSVKSEIIGPAVSVLADEQASEAEVTTAASENQAAGELNTLTARTTIAARSEAFSLLGSLRTKPLLFRGALSDVVAAEPADSGDTAAPIGRRATLGVRERYTAARFGEGFARLAAESDQYESNRNVVRNIGTSGRVTQLDALSAKIPSPRLGEFSRRLLDTARTNANNAGAVRDLIDEELKTLDPPTRLG